MENLEKLRYPIGPFVKPETITKEMLQHYISVIEAFPTKIKSETDLLTDEQLNTPYRPDGWTIRQVVNHCSDSHMHALIRVKYALTEPGITIMPYQQDLWAYLPDTKTISIDPALNILAGVHARWTLLLRSLNDTQWKMTYVHPEKGRAVPLDESAASYAWHCEHHLGHITALKKRMNWS